MPRQSVLAIPFTLSVKLHRSVCLDAPTGVTQTGGNSHRCSKGLSLFSFHTRKQMSETKQQQSENPGQSLSFPTGIPSYQHHDHHSLINHRRIDSSQSNPIHSRKKRRMSSPAKTISVVIVAKGYPLPAERLGRRSLLVFQRPLRRPRPVQGLAPRRPSAAVLPVPAATSVAPSRPTPAPASTPSFSHAGAPTPSTPSTATLVSAATVGLTTRGLTPTSAPPSPAASVLGTPAAAAPARGAVSTGPPGLVAAA